MRTRLDERAGAIAILVVMAVTLSARGAGEKVLAEWAFGGAPQWNGWTPNGEVRDVRFNGRGVSFRTVGSDPIIQGPLFELVEASNAQCVVIDLECSAAGRGELYYTNKTTGPYAGFEPKWSCEVLVPGPGRHRLTVWPFWGSLKKIIRLRFDPPSGVEGGLSRIRIVDLAESAVPPIWDFSSTEHSWRSMHAAVVTHVNQRLIASAAAPQAIVISTVAPFDAARQSILRLNAGYSDRDPVGFYWATDEEPGLYGRPILLPAGPEGAPVEIDLRCFPQWKGRVTHLAFAFGALGGEKLALRSLRLDENEAGRPFVRLHYMGFDRPINRPGKPARVRLLVEHGGGPSVAAGTMTIETDASARCEQPAVAVPAIEPGKRADIIAEVVPLKAGETVVTARVNGQVFSRALRVDEPITSPDLLARGPGHYEVPVPRPAKTRYQIGIYYFPGWSPDQVSRWKSQADYPERDPVLGWYKEGLPEVADWHIKWAVENGLSFFLYDWYWRDGTETLEQGLNQGFLKARYRDYMKFAIMWANHPPFANHSREQLLTVTDYWLKHYLRQPNYLTIDGKPYVSFFSVHHLLTELGGPEKTRAAFESMRQRVREAGLAGLHIAACTGGDSGMLAMLQQAGFDSVTAYNYPRAGATMTQSVYRSFVLGHESIWKDMSKAGGLPYFPLLTVGWDARPWHGPRTDQRFARRPEDFAEGLARLKVHLDETGQRLGILEAWNEWGEGSYIEPNAEFGFKDLEAIRRTFAEPGNWPVNVAPDDVGLGGRYDLRTPASTPSPPATPR